MPPLPIITKNEISMQEYEAHDNFSPFIQKKNHPFGSLLFAKIKLDIVNQKKSKRM